MQKDRITFELPVPVKEAFAYMTNMSGSDTSTRLRELMFIDLRKAGLRPTGFSTWKEAYDSAKKLPKGPIRASRRRSK